MTDVQRLISSRLWIPTHFAARTNELRALGATGMFAAGIDAYADQQLIVPVSPASATMDNGILLCHVELHSGLRRLISVLKGRQSAIDPVIQEFTIGERGIVATKQFCMTSSRLMGHAAPAQTAQPHPAP